jgi:hypothetical protein
MSSKSANLPRYGTRLPKSPHFSHQARSYPKLFPLLPPRPPLHRRLHTALDFSPLFRARCILSTLLMVLRYC